MAQVVDGEINENKNHGSALTFFEHLSEWPKHQSFGMFYIVNLDKVGIGIHLSELKIYWPNK